MKKRLSSLLTMATILALLVCVFTCSAVIASASTTEPDFYFTDDAVKWDAKNGQFVVDFGGKNFDDGQTFRPYLKGYDPSEYSFKLDNDGDGNYTDTPGYFAFYDAGVYRFAAFSNASGKLLAKSVLVINKIAYPGTAPSVNDIPESVSTDYYDGTEITSERLYELFEEYFEFDRESVRISFSCPQTVKYAGTYVITASFEHDNYTIDTTIDFEYKIVKTLIEAPTFTDYELNEKYVYSGEEYILVDTTDKEYRSNGTNVATDAGTHTVTLSLTDKDRYAWDTTGTSDDISYDFTINKAKYDMSLVGFKDVKYVYNGEIREIVYQGTLPHDTEVKYTAKLPDGTIAEGQNWLTNVGYVDVTVEFSNNNYEFETREATLTITTRYVDRPEADNRVFVYNANMQEYRVPASIFYTVSDNKQTTAGTYTVTVALDKDNCLWADGSSDDMLLTFEIMRAPYDPAPKFVGDRFKYDNEHHEPVLVGVPEGVSYTLSYEKLVGDRYIKATEVISAGKYRITATFSGMDEVNYLPLEPLSFEYEVYVEYVNTQFVKTDGNNLTLITVTCSLAVPDYLTLNVTDVTGAYKKVTLLDGTVANVLRAYDVNFVGYGSVQTPDGSFRITLHVPDEILKNENLRVAYINSDGEAVLHEYKIENGVIVFDTEHFSVYSVIEVLDSVVAAADEGSNAWIFIVIAIVVVILALLAVFFILRRRSSGPENTPAADEPIVEVDNEVAIPEVEEVVVEEPVVEEPVVEEPVVEEPVVEEPVVEEPVVEEPVAEEPVVETVEEAPTAKNEVESASANHVVVNGEAVEVHYRSSFLSRLIQAESEAQDYYTVIKNTLLSYKEIKARTSWNFETFNKGRIKCAKVNIKGKTLMVCLNLNPKDFNINKYHFADMSDNPKYDDAPLMMKIKSERSLKYTIELIGEMMKLYEIEQGEMPNVDYHMPYEDNETLAQRGLVKVTLSSGAKADATTAMTSVDVDQVLSRAKAQAAVADLLTHEKEVIEEPIFVDAVHADELITDTQAEELVIHVVEKSKSEPDGKKVAINLDVICENFEDGEQVNLESLKARKLISESAASVKILARGIMTKKLVITADKYSLQAVKMIVLAGGKANLID